MHVKHIFIFFNLIFVISVAVDNDVKILKEENLYEVKSILRGKLGINSYKDNINISLRVGM